MRYVFAGAEKLKDETRAMWTDKFGVQIFEGYGATETSPGLAMQHADRLCASAPWPLSARHRVRGSIPCPASRRAADSSVRGPERHARLSQARPARRDPAAVDRRGPGWYDTGDIVSVDDDGFVTIRGRAKRFAKIGGEMVSLAAVEELAARTWPDAQHAVVSLPDAQKGEQLVLVTTQADASARRASRRAREPTASGELHVPKRIMSAREAAAARQRQGRLPGRRGSSRRRCREPRACHDRGVFVLLGAQFLTALADNAILFTAIAMLIDAPRGALVRARVAERVSRRVRACSRRGWARSRTRSRSRSCS